MVVSQYTERRLPYDLDAEGSLLGALLIDGEALHRVMPLVKPEDYHRARNRFCYEACIAVSQRGDAVDQVTVARELQQGNRLEEVGGLAYLGQLIADTPTSVNVEHYAGIVADTAAKRRIIDAGNRIAQIGYEDAGNAEETMQLALDALYRAQPLQTGRGYQPLSGWLEAYLQGDDGEVAAQGMVRPSGFHAIDRILGGLRDSDLLIVGARPGMGKSSIALDLAVNVARSGATAAICSLEMSGEQIAARMLASAAMIPAVQIQAGLLSDIQQSIMVNAVGELSGLRIFIDEDSPFQTIDEIRAKAQRLQLEAGLDFLVVDYIQLIQGSGRRGDNRVQEMSEISRGLKLLAMELNCPVLACSQLNRSIESRQGHRPQLSDLRDSGSIEQDADVVMFISRDDKMFSSEEWAELHPGQPYPEGVAEIIIAKNRHGPTGSALLFFRERLTRFENLHERQREVAA